MPSDSRGFGRRGVGNNLDRQRKAGFYRRDAYAQTKRCLEIIEESLRPFGLNRVQIIRTRLFVTDISRWEDFGRAHGEFFKDYPPAASMLEVRALMAPELLIEIEADAVLS